MFCLQIVIEIAQEKEKMPKLALRIQTLTFLFGNFCNLQKSFKSILPHRLQMMERLDHFHYILQTCFDRICLLHWYSCQAWVKRSKWNNQTWLKVKRFCMICYDRQITLLLSLGFTSWFRRFLSQKQNFASPMHNYKIICPIKVSGEVNLNDNE